MNSWRLRTLRIAIALLPVLAFAVGTPLLNHVEPRIVGLPLNLAWIILWILLTPLCLLAIERLRNVKT